MHRRLTHDGWRDPQALPDAFAWRWFGWHVVQAGESSRLRDLLLDYRWLAAKLRATDPQALASDLELVSHLEPFALIRDALRLVCTTLAETAASSVRSCGDAWTAAGCRRWTACWIPSPSSRRAPGFGWITRP